MPCPESVKKCRIETLVKHIKTVHKKIHNIKCRQCGEGFHTKKQIEKHVRVGHQDTFLYCRASVKETGGECGKILYSDEGLISHVQCKHMDVQVVCLECSIAVFPGYLAHHITSVHSNDATVRCVVKECGDSFGGFSELRQHVDTAHHALALEWCEECSRFVLRLIEHNKVHHDAKLHFQPVFAVCLGVWCDCKHCDFMARGEGQLCRHVYVKYQKIANVKCEECGKSVKDYKKHVRVFHDELRIDTG